MRKYNTYLNLIRSINTINAVRRRVVVTGLGVVSPLGTGSELVWTNILKGKCGIVALNDEEYINLPCRLAGLIPREKDGIVEKALSKSTLKSMAPATSLALVATSEALKDANWTPKSEHCKEMTGVAIGMGYGLSGDASHITTPREDGSGAMLSMARALKDGNLQKEDITYINAHATSTPIGDGIESTAIKSLFKEHALKISVSSTKGAHGHLLGAAGNLEAMFTILSCYHGVLPPTLNLDDPVDDLCYVVKNAKKWDHERRIALKNSFGFGGTNASLCIANIL
ncbi:3-oxoacyl-[acyl-carrier-protein] synthase, mitochondrial isoform X3 [Bombyx mandarina]|uniref:beta-ketoacyl-[acyl-carrier-protein] synthase I n=1 Tax=Bombyx mandarina TaxID=7092 RepID=A0A6J2KF87_BOMMA|nr:3-oxoacyl-[acyl-carrier-protein] synthase, mitochondrial isoform X3 [Bombyx mandarina]